VKIFKRINSDIFSLSRTIAISQLCVNFEDIDPQYDIDCAQCVNNMKEMALPKHKLFEQCDYRDELDCDELFEETVTEEGICYTFNSLKMSEIYREESITDDFNFLNHNHSSDGHWSMEGGYSAIAPLDVYPRRALGSGDLSGLYTVLQMYEEDFDYKCGGAVQGFKMMLHTVGEIPHASNHYLRISLNQEIRVAIKPQMMTTSEGLRHYPPEKRQCYFNDERQLRFFKVYTQRNCEHECLANFTLEKCGCIKFNMPSMGIESL
jgi:acid-sensing ion channel, other